MARKMQEVLKNPSDIFINTHTYETFTFLDSHVGSFNTDVNTSTTLTADAKTLFIIQKTTSEDSSPAQDMLTQKPSNSLMSYKQPYFGWRSQEKLKQPRGFIATPSQRLASSLQNNARLSRIVE